MTSKVGCLAAITSPKSVLLVEPWFDGSHRAWAEGYQSHSGHSVALVTLPGRFWRWRLRGAAVTLAAQVTDFCRRHGAPDILLVSSMVDLAELVGLAVVEAMAAGCVPVLPQSLSYPELVPPQFHEAALYRPGAFRSTLARVLSSPDQAKASVAGLAETMRVYDWSTVAPLMDETLAAAVEERYR